MPGESFKFLMVWCLAKPVDFRRSQVSQVSTGSCSMPDALINQDILDSSYETNLVACNLLVGYGLASKPANVRG